MRIFFGICNNHNIVIFAKILKGKVQAIIYNYFFYIYEDGTVEATNSYTSAIKHTRRGTLNIKNVTLKANSTQNYLKYIIHVIIEHIIDNFGWCITYLSK